MGLLAMSFILARLLKSKIWKWWGKSFQYGYDFSETNVSYFFNMNEPTIFHQIEGTLPNHSIHFGGYENREIHNILCLLISASTYEDILNRDERKNSRSILVVRSFFAGSQKYCWA
jgi:alpha 1,3-glucosidase